ncbi:MAG: DUF3795 domain-containing protein [Bacteroidales bacterium]|nr:DUF3795 domain-containing protein [Bacteroidales bacterium]
MDYEKIKEKLAPCGLHCGKCFAYEEGDIVKYSKTLKNNLGSFEVYAKRFVDLLDKPVFEKYPDFKDMLECFAISDCSGCRKEVCKLFKDCKVRLCSENKGVDFCFQCPDFPCENTGFDEHLYKRSININIRMKEIGVDNYYEEIKNKSRY